MAKLNLAGSATFTASVDIPIPGGKAVSVEFTFNWFLLDEFREICGNGATDEEVIGKILHGWELEDQLSPENIHRFVQRYGAGARAIIGKYWSEVTGARLGN